MKNNDLQCTLSIRVFKVFQIDIHVKFNVFPEYMYRRQILKAKIVQD